MSWGNGYVTDIEYSEGFYPDQAPTHLALAATFNGYEPPPMDGHFVYCELGCGQGRTSLVLAALHPDAEFHAVDFNPAHIAHARQQARQAGLRNMTFHELSFDELTSPRCATLPLFDMVTMHGVWTWIAPALQDAILAFLNARLNPGGLVYVSYNALPGWSQVAPLQRLVKELAAATPQRSDLAVARAIEQIERFADAKIISPRFQDGVERLKDSRHKLLPYLAHEYLNQHWQPMYFVDVARAFAGAKLNFAACSDLLKNFYNLSLTEAQHQMLADVASPELRETLKDFCTDHWFRQDVFLRGARRMSARRRDELLAGRSLTLLRPAPEVFEIGKADGSRWRPDPEVYGAIVTALERGPQHVSDLLAMDTLPRGHLVGPVELVGTLVGTGLAGIYQESEPAIQAAADQLNGLQEVDDDRALSQGAVIAVPALRTGMTLSPANYALYRTLKRGGVPDTDELSAQFIQRCEERGAHPVIDGKEIEDMREAKAAVAHDYSAKIERLVPLWRNAGLFS